MQASMESAYLQKVVDAIKEKHPKLEYFEPERLAIFDDEFLGGGGLAAAVASLLGTLLAVAVLCTLSRAPRPPSLMTRFGRRRLLRLLPRVRG